MKIFFKVFRGTKKAIFILTLFVVLSSCNENAQKIKVEELTCEYLENPLGVDVQHPRFSWKIISDQRGILQSAYQIIVGENPNEVKKGTGKIWDSGKITSDATVNVEYNGTPLQSNKKYFWKVKVWTNNEDFVWSNPASFHTGMLKDTDWESNWITSKEQIEDASPLLRKEFSVNKKIEEAYAFVPACGFYEFYLNGKKVGDHVLGPAITDYRKTLLYSTFDVTEFLKQGKILPVPCWGMALII